MIAAMQCPLCQAENNETAERCAQCGRELLALGFGSVLAARYEILNPLGAGGLGRVYRAHDRMLDEVVAVKVLHPEAARSEELATRFRSEIKLARKVRHRNVCAIHEYGEEGAFRFVAMELVDGVDLGRVVREQGPLPPREAFDVAVQVAKGLVAIHDAGVIHRDLKTPNIMRDTRGVVRLLDFGIAKRSTASPRGTLALTGEHRVVGTPEYMSPEQARGDELDGRSDIYAFGIVLFEILTGAVPFHANTPVGTLLRQINDAPPLDGPDAARIPPSLLPVLRRTLAKDARDRYDSARDLLEALRVARAIQYPEAAVTPPPLPAVEDGAPEVPQHLKTTVLPKPAFARPPHTPGDEPPAPPLPRGAKQTPPAASRPGTPGGTMPRPAPPRPGTPPPATPRPPVARAPMTPLDPTAVAPRPPMPSGGARRFASEKPLPPSPSPGTPTPVDTSPPGLRPPGTGSQKRPPGEKPPLPAGRARIEDPPTARESAASAALDLSQTFVELSPVGSDLSDVDSGDTAGPPLAAAPARPPLPPPRPAGLDVDRWLSVLRGGLDSARAYRGYPVAENQPLLIAAGALAAAVLLLVVVRLVTSRGPGSEAAAPAAEASAAPAPAVVAVEPTPAERATPAPASFPAATQPTPVAGLAPPGGGAIPPTGGPPSTPAAAPSAKPSRPSPMPTAAPLAVETEAPAPPPTPRPRQRAARVPRPTASPSAPALPPRGSIELDVRPWAEVLVDGAPSGRTPIAAIEVAPGPHDVRLSHPAYWPLQRTIAVEAGRASRLDVDLQWEGIARSARSAPYELPLDDVPSDPYYSRGVGQLKDGDFRGAVLTLEPVVRRLTFQPKRRKELARAQFCLGVAYLELGREVNAKTSFLAALENDGSIKPAPGAFPAKVITFFSHAKESRKKP
jgi:serine/threonine protein kinase